MRAARWQQRQQPQELLQHHQSPNTRRAGLRACCRERTFTCRRRCHRPRSRPCCAAHRPQTWRPCSPKTWVVEVCAGRQAHTHTHTCLCVAHRGRAAVASPTQRSGTRAPRLAAPSTARHAPRRAAPATTQCKAAAVHALGGLLRILQGELGGVADGVLGVALGEGLRERRGRGLHADDRRVVVRGAVAAACAAALQRAAWCGCWCMCVCVAGQLGVGVGGTMGSRRPAARLMPPNARGTATPANAATIASSSCPWCACKAPSRHQCGHPPACAAVTCTMCGSADRWRASARQWRAQARSTAFRTLSTLCIRVFNHTPTVQLMQTHQQEAQDRCGDRVTRHDECVLGAGVGVRTGLIRCLR
jgi:hypothetical protein